MAGKQPWTDRKYCQDYDYVTCGWTAYTERSGSAQMLIAGTGLSSVLLSTKEMLLSQTLEQPCPMRQTAAALFLNSQQWLQSQGQYCLQPALHLSALSTDQDFPLQTSPLPNIHTKIT